jgi:hypothetical protein
MKKLIFLAIGAAVLYRAAKYFGISSWADLKEKLLPQLKEIKDLAFAK